MMSHTVTPITPNTMTATVTPDASPHGHPIASTNSGANSCPLRKSHSAGTANATFSSTLRPAIAHVQPRR